MTLRVGGRGEGGRRVNVTMTLIFIFTSSLDVPPNSSK